MDHDIVKAWVAASADPGIQVVAPFVLISETSETILFEAHIADFGGPRGTVVGNQDTGFDNVRHQFGYYPSNLFPSYRTYDRETFY